MKGYRCTRRDTPSGYVFLPRNSFRINEPWGKIVRFLKKRSIMRSPIVLHLCSWTSTTRRTALHAHIVPFSGYAAKNPQTVYSRYTEANRNQMPRILNERDRAILAILAPEMKELCCEESEHEFQSILPPVSNHFARDERDFAERIARLSRDDLEYLVARILDGSESMGCMPPEDVDSLVALIERRISPDAAEKVRNAYGVEPCDLDLTL
jgi:hypothetical protein